MRLESHGFRAKLMAHGAQFGSDVHDATPRDFGDFEVEYRALVESAAVVDLSDRTQIELTGDDRASFLHNMCTNEIRKLAVGAGCEAFLTDARGHVLGLVNVFCGPESLLLETVPGQAEFLIAHLEKYHIRENLDIRDRSTSCGELLLAGPKAGELLATVIEGRLPVQWMDESETILHGTDVLVRRVDFTRPDGFLLSIRRAALDHAWDTLVGAEAVPCGRLAFEAARIEAGTPWFGIDVTSDNLPQEVARDARTISFVKGCYIGQETVARIDALGHVNRLLVGVRFAGDEVPEPGAELLFEAQAVGRVTSATFSPLCGAPLALAYVRRGSHQPGTSLTCSGHHATVVSLPLEG